MQYQNSKMRTPWGQADQEERFQVGPNENDVIVSVCTPGHGGYYVPSHLVSKIPANQRAWAAKWSGSPQWYEEDCCWAAVALAFPQICEGYTRPASEVLESAAAIVKEYCRQ